MPTEPDWRQSWNSASNPANQDGNPIFTYSDNHSLSVFTFQFTAPPFTRAYARPKHVLLSIRAMLDFSRARVNEIELIPYEDSFSSGMINTSVAEFFRYIIEALGIPEDLINITNASTRMTGPFSTDTSAYLDVISDFAVRTGQIVWSGPNMQANVIPHPNWSSGPYFISHIIIDHGSAEKVEVMPYTGYPISQMQVTVKDGDGNTVLGVYPQIPFSVGEVVIDPVPRIADTWFANSIARMLYNEKSSAKLKVTMVGPAPWARPGAYRVDVNYVLDTGVVISGPYYISSVEHEFAFGDIKTQRSWITTLELTKLFGAS